MTGLSPEAVAEAGNTNPRVLAIGAVLIGISLAAAIQVLTGYFTETGRRPVNDVAASSETGAATVLLAGISVGFESAVYSAMLIASAVFGAFLLGGGSVVLPPCYRTCWHRTSHNCGSNRCDGHIWPNLR